MKTVLENLIDAEEKALVLFQEIENRGLIISGKSENELNREIFALANELFGIEKYWHKRIVRSGSNTLLPYRENPPDLILQDDDILFFDFGPVFEDWEADFGRTYVIGNDPFKKKMCQDIEAAWYEAKSWFLAQHELTGAMFFDYAVQLAEKYGWEFGGPIAGHIIGQFPHEKLETENFNNYIHPENYKLMSLPDEHNAHRHWILEIHFVDRKKQIGGFFEQLLC
ncbi:M24 family metallopeptidase [soil metagenome]